MVLKVVSSGGGGSSGQLNYLGTWNAATNNPTLTSGVGTKNTYYVVSTAGTTLLDGINLWSVGDWAIFNGTVWEKINGGSTESFANIAVTSLTGYMFANGSNVVTASPTIPVANVSGAVANTTTITAGGLLTGGGNLASNVTISLANVPSGNVTGLGTMATQNANNVNITGGVEGNVTYSNVTINSGTFIGANVKVSNGVWSTSTFNSTYTDGIVVDYTTGNGRISVGAADGLTFYNGGVGTNVLGNVSPSGVWNLANLVSGNVSITGGTINVQTTNLTATTAASATFATSSLPLVPAGYLEIDLNGTVVKIPYYAV